MSGVKNGSTILLAVDDLEVRRYLATALKYQGYAVEVAQDGDEAIACFHARKAPISAIVMDVFMPRKDGIEALKEIRRFDPDVPVIMISGAASPLNVVEVMKSGASDFIPKPVEPGDLRKALKALLGNGNGRSAPSADETPGPLSKQVFFGASPQMQDIQRTLGQIGWSDVPILIRGETGVGKEVVARELHARSPRSKKPMLKLNCAALPSDLVESELFGYEKGAFTGAFQKKPGMFELADGGTILLDEIGDMDFRLQAKLLQVLQDQQFQRLGGKETIKVDVRIIAATHRNLEKAMAERGFREDLYYRLNVISIRVPPLRERQDDVIEMADFLLKKHAAPNAAPLQLPPVLKERFLAYRWPGNVRELENVIRKFLVLRDARVIEQDLRQEAERKSVTELRTAVGPLLEQPSQPSPVSLETKIVAESSAPVLAQVEQAKREAERTAILAALKSSNWNRKRAAVLLQVDYKALLYRMKRLDIKKEKRGPATLRPTAEIAVVPQGRRVA